MAKAQRTDDAPGMTLDTPVVTTPPRVEQVSTVDQDGQPYCPLHNCRMVAQGSERDETLYKCKVPGCKMRSRRVRGKVPAEPQKCPMVTCKAGDGFYLEVDAPRTTLGELVMVCPNCGYTARVPRPGYTAPIRRVVEDFGDR